MRIVEEVNSTNFSMILLSQHQFQKEGESRCAVNLHNTLSDSTPFFAGRGWVGTNGQWQISLGPMAKSRCE